MIQVILYVLTIILVSICVYLISYVRFRKLIAQQTKQMIHLMKSEDLGNLQIGDIYNQVDEDFSYLERAALTLRRKYLRLKVQSREERRGYETVLSGLKEAIITVDQNLKVISFNNSFMTYFQWAPSKEQNYYHLHDIIRDPQIISTFKKSFELSQTIRSELDHLDLLVTPLPSLNENESWSLGVFYDLSEIKKTERIRIDFVANASHEMRTPLTVIKGYSDLLLQTLKRQDLKAELELMRPIAQSTEQMSDLMEKLLDLSKIEQSVKLEKSVISTKEITDEVLTEVDNIRRLHDKKIEVVTDIPNVLASRDALKQILRNLIVNSIKYSGEAEKIEIKWFKSGAKCCLTVKDFGVGIPVEHQDRIFERFYRIDKGRNRNQGGFGLGLALVKHHVLNHGGQIKLYSEAGKGSEFTCDFPLT